MTNLTAMSLLALLVGIFLIFNSVNFSVLQRRRGLFAVLRALGLTRRELLLAHFGGGGAARRSGCRHSVGVAVGVSTSATQLLAIGRADLSMTCISALNALPDVSVSAACRFIKGMHCRNRRVRCVAAAWLPAMEAAIVCTAALAMSRSTLERRTFAFTAVGHPWRVSGCWQRMLIAVVILLFSAPDLVAGLDRGLSCSFSASHCAYRWVVRAIAAIRSWRTGCAGCKRHARARMAIAGIASRVVAARRVADGCAGNSSFGDGRCECDGRQLPRFG